MAANEKDAGDEGSPVTMGPQAAPNPGPLRGPTEAAKPPDEEVREQPSPAKAGDPEDDAEAKAEVKPEAKAEVKPEVKAKAPEPPAPEVAERKGARWADPISRFDARWTWFEARLITFVLFWQLSALVAWVLLNGLSESV